MKNLKFIHQGMQTIIQGEDVNAVGDRFTKTIVFDHNDDYLVTMIEYDHGSRKFYKEHPATVYLYSKMVMRAGIEKTYEEA